MMQRRRGEYLPRFGAIRPAIRPLRDRLDQNRRVTEGTTFEGEENDEDYVFKKATEAMVVARLLGYVFLSGPDKRTRTRSGAA